MNFQNEIFKLEKSIESNTNQLNKLTNNPLSDKKTITELFSKNIELNKELNRIRKLMWEQMHEQIDIDEDDMVAYRTNKLYETNNPTNFWEYELNHNSDYYTDNTNDYFTEGK